MVGAHFILWCDPKAVPPPNLKVAFPCAALFVFFLKKDVLAGQGSIGRNSRTDIEGDDEFDVIVREEQIVLPAEVRNDFFSHGSADGKLRGLIAGAFIRTSAPVRTNSS